MSGLDKKYTFEEGPVEKQDRTDILKKDFFSGVGQTIDAVSNGRTALLNNDTTRKLQEIASNIGVDRTFASTLIRTALLPPNPNRNSDFIYRNSPLGTIIERYIVLSWFIEGVEYEIFLDASFLQFDRKKEVIKTPIIGKIGEVKELMYIGDTNIKISGLLIGTEKNTISKSPRDKIYNLYKLQNFNDVVYVESDILNSLGIDKIVIEDISISESTQYFNVANFTISAYSDTEIKFY